MQISGRNNMRTLLAIIGLFFITTAHATLSFSTSAFSHEGPLPVLYTCDGKDVSPKMAWSDAPALSLLL
jgi:phosphatidylethanolamine-binding protein (PEBP) family uncharacterized protein